MLAMKWIVKPILFSTVTLLATYTADRLYLAAAERYAKPDQQPIVTASITDASGSGISVTVPIAPTSSAIAQSMA
jgi:hypothetical protein